MLYYPKRDLGHVIDDARIFYGEGRGESGVCLHLPLKNHMAGAAPTEDYMLMLTLANTIIEYLLYKRAIKGPEAWDYDPERACEQYTVCGDNLSSSGIVVFDTTYTGGPKIFIYLDKTFGSNEIAVGWKNGRPGDEKLLSDFEQYMKEGLPAGLFVATEE